MGRFQKEAPFRFPPTSGGAILPQPLGGCIFGDHCSPISDTTIMTCSTTGCDIIDHVKTQAPYCVSIAVVSFVMYVIFGFVL